MCTRITQLYYIANNMERSEIEVGMKVTYKPEHKKDSFGDNGIVKSLNEMDPTMAFVVYNCAGDWDNYQNYTGASTKISDLQKGWYK